MRNKNAGKVSYKCPRCSDEIVFLLLRHDK